MILYNSENKYLTINETDSFLGKYGIKKYRKPIQTKTSK